MGPRFRGDDIEQMRIRATRWLAMTVLNRLVSWLFEKLSGSVRSTVDLARSFSPCPGRGAAYFTLRRRAGTQHVAN